MDSSYSLTHTSTTNWKTATNIKPQAVKNKYQLLEKVEKISLIGAVLGGVFAAMSQQVLYASVPFSLSLTLISQTSRRRFELEQQIRQNQTDTIASVQQSNNFYQQQLEELNTAITQLQQSQSNSVEGANLSISSLKQQLEELNTAISQLEENPQNYITRRHLSPIIIKLRQLQRQQKATKISSVGSLVEQVETLQQQIDEINTIALRIKLRTNKFAETLLQLASASCPGAFCLARSAITLRLYKSVAKIGSSS